MKHWLIVGLGAVLLLGGCASKDDNAGRYSIKQDRGPDQAIDLSRVPDAVPRAEPPSRWGNKNPYTVLGKRYTVLPSAEGYRQRGIASWYGKKFHGHTTSNGEVYDMYQMSAAHKSLPLPSYVRVTNLDNGRQVVVRVNDRGPFHDDRLIDLSYAAAYRLGVLQQGTARVEVEAISPGASAPVLAQASGLSGVPAEQAAINGRTLQVVALSNADNAEAVALKLRGLLDEPVQVQSGERDGRLLHRVRLGPLSGSHTLNWLLQQLSQAGYPGAHLVDLP
ncbi:MAG: septal ring lytic transglycosylase RlpA family protein [Oceanospirillales bacterium]|uniref:Endolytic peptidoglycan transglycosylase RlpA n=1 Tax=Marinobacterium halophilum TaxID=267374 RepID=A0A2P8ETE6_9GAMM|nr:septal ring lytic transglycosylase RlpA family protein [Marinobacterium halophilum]MBR9830107.1 septal ring lytic transglycosylase RlpA family protein [Oceanospirillales bacterium]PSL12722.1 rare lipoprotein A [Marinobacterium halophilum]